MKMRRALSITVALLLGLSMAAPFFAVDAASSLPACCRRSGMHHCAVGAIADDGSKAATTTIAPICPNWPKSTAAPWPNHLASTTAEGMSIPLFARPKSAHQTEARYRVAFARSRQKRGPPAISL